MPNLSSTSNLNQGQSENKDQNVKAVFGCNANKFALMQNHGSANDLYSHAFVLVQTNLHCNQIQPKGPNHK
uniref:Uncharacterized protein n=1 Tax=Nelumbo nucifera TaxID=4432 RepID=A0A822XDI1_NELNU|nr:TPA_asm: hypothetical protein HUJ06_020957 [Nelumbo nucifera]